MNKYLREAYIKYNDKDFSMVVENMKRKAIKGLISESTEDIDKEVSEVIELDKTYEKFEEEVDEALEKFSYMIEE